jgi:hypothetical protein
MEEVLQEVPVKLSIVEKTEGCWEVRLTHMRVPERQDSTRTVLGQHRDSVG